ncbi:biotin/lipoyl-binding protein [Candidatus Gracilibacteria bacterium]|nr:biotin/lipoyl-binding protein [Candidatus Gracilibacteria bacterium]
MKKLLIILTLASILATACTKQDESPINRDFERESGIKEVEIFDLKNEQTELNFSKSGTATAETTVSINPQINGRVTSIKVKIGDSVEKGTILFELGDSLSTDTIDTQKNSADTTYSLTKDAEYYQWHGGNLSVKAAGIALKQAENSYLNTVISKRNAQNTFSTQIDNSEIEIDNSELSLKTAEENLDDLQDTLEDMEDDLDDLEYDLDGSEQDAVTEQSIDQLERLIDSTEQQEDQLRLQVKLAENRIQQAHNALTLLEEGLDSQIDQLNFAIQSSFAQYQSAKTQQQSAIAASQLQELNSQIQSNNAKTNRELTTLSANEKKIKSPISGKVTEITITEGNLVSPGQVIAKIKNTDSLIIKTAINSDEAALIAVGDKVMVDSEEGIITSISPSADEITKKINVEIVIQNSEIKAESLVDIKFFANQKNRIFIPLNSIFLQNNKKFVKILNEKNRIQLQEVELGEILGIFVEITSGLNRSEEIIEAKGLFLEEGEKVKIKLGKKTIQFGHSS